MWACDHGNNFSGEYLKKGVCLFLTLKIEENTEQTKFYGKGNVVFSVLSLHFWGHTNYFGMFAIQVPSLPDLPRPSACIDSCDATDVVITHGLELIEFFSLWSEALGQCRLSLSCPRPSAPCLSDAEFFAGSWVWRSLPATRMRLVLAETSEVWVGIRSFPNFPLEQGGSVSLIASVLSFWGFVSFD